MLGRGNGLETEWRKYTSVNYTTICSSNVLSPGRCKAIIWTNAGILLIGPFETNFSEISIEIYRFSFRKMYLKMSSGNLQPFCLGLSQCVNRISSWRFPVVHILQGLQYDTLFCIPVINHLMAMLRDEESGVLNKVKECPVCYFLPVVVVIWHMFFKMMMMWMPLLISMPI